MKKENDVDTILYNFNDNFTKSQQKLDIEFEEILLDNLWELYETDEIMNIYTTPKGTNYLFDLYKNFIEEEKYMM